VRRIPSLAGNKKRKMKQKGLSLLHSRTIRNEMRDNNHIHAFVKSKRERSFHPRFEHLISAVGQIDCDESSVAVELNPAVFLYEGSFPHSSQFEIVDRKLQPFVSDFPTDSAGIKTFLRACSKGMALPHLIQQLLL
jgi:hypothetical protein